MDESQPDSNVFSLRIVSIDYYMSPPIPGLDLCYSSFQGGKVNEVPVIRVFGSTPAGQKTCLHIHRALPYLYVPCSDIVHQPDQKADACMQVISLALEKALKLKSSAGSKRQHVHACSLVRAKRLYGYDASEELYAKLHLYYPQDVSRAANLLLDGSVLEKSLQPHESHIPFLLQFLVDYNLYGMGHLHVSKMKFRPPVPDIFRKRRDNYYAQHKQLIDNSWMATNFQADSSGDGCVESPVWLSSTIPDSWIWHSPSQDQGFHLAKRQSVCELEGDAIIDDILNQHCKSYSSLSQTLSSVRMVQSLVPIWEEFERTAVHMETIPTDPEKPDPHKVLSALSNGLEFSSKLMELCDMENSLPRSRVEADKMFLQSIRSSGDGRDVVDGGHANLETESPVHLSSGELHLSQASLPYDLKVADPEALRLLNWLASSQSAEDINSDDELIRETILSPLMPVTTISKVLEKADMDFESASQQECQDILDSVEDSIDVECKNKMSAPSVYCSASPGSSKKAISQVDGSGDCERLILFTGKTSKMEKNSDSEKYVKEQVHTDSGSSHSRKPKRKGPLWSSLPLCLSENMNDVFQPMNVKIGRHDSDLKLGTGTCSLAANDAGGSSNIVMDNAEKYMRLPKDTNTMVGCSVRDLMRRKRYHRGEPPGVESNLSGKAILEDKSSNYSLSSTPRSDEQEKRPNSSNARSCSIAESADFYVKDVTMKTSGVEDCGPGSGDVEKTGFTAGSEGFQNTPYITNFENQNSAVQMNHDENHGKEINDDGNHLWGSVKMQQKHAAFSSGISGTSAKDFEDIEITTGVTFMQSDRTVPIENSVESIAFSFYGKPPVINFPAADGIPSIGCCSSPDVYADEEINVTGKGVDDCPPFFGGEYQEVQEGLQNWSERDDYIPHRAMGIPTHFHNDGSYLYMLTPAFLPPSTEDVTRWLLHDGTDVMRENMNASTTNRSSPKGSLGNAVDSHECSADVCIEPFLDSRSTSSRETNLDNVKKEGRGGHVMKSQTCNPGAVAVLQTTRDSVPSKQQTVCSLDISQISGPEGKSKLTPLSQSGFRDPASIGAGQQLTMFSIEVQAESRGDLRPDPRFDAVNFIVIAIQEDDQSRVDSYILLRSEMATVKRNLDGVTGYNMLVFSEERHLFNEFVNIVCNYDPDIVMGWDIQGGSLGFLAERAAFLGIGLLDKISRTPCQPITTAEVSDIPDKTMVSEVLPEASNPTTNLQNDAIIEDEWGRTHASGVHVGGRIVLNVWRLVRGEVKLNMYTAEAVSEAVLRRKIPFVHSRTLTRWFYSGPGQARYRCIEYVLERAKLNFQIMNQLDMINRTSELARVFGIDFFSVLSRGSQYRVESMLVRLAHTQNYLAISPGTQQVASQPAMECVPLVMEPESGFYADPVIVLDFQSLYPSMVIAYNLCFCTCLGKVTPPKPNTLGVSSYTPDSEVLRAFKRELLLTPNGVMYVPPKVRQGVLPRLLDEILSTRIMVKQAMKKLSPSQQVLHRIYNARQLALKLIANVTYGYTAAGFSGRMPCAELADSIVQCGRRTLENAILLVNTHDKWKAKVIYGDTDSMFVLLPGRSVSEAFEIGNEIASEVTKRNPNPVVLKMEKVYHPCFLLTKKRYVGYSYEKIGQVKPLFDAKGIETIRRDTCEAVSKTMERSLRLYFEAQDIVKVKSYLLRQWTRILSGRISIQDFVFAKEVRLGTYSSRISSLPPAAIVATRAIKADPRAEPRYAERIPYVVVHGQPGSKLVDMVVDPLDLLALDSPFRLNDLYYINKQIIPALQRVFGLVGADLNQWFLEMPRPVRESVSKRQSFVTNSHRTRIDYYYLSKHCVICGDLVQASAAPLCSKCSKNEAVVAAAITGRTAKMEREIQHLAAICRHCGGGDWLIESGVKCTSLACSVFYERRKLQKELQSLSSLATQSGFYPNCVSEWF